MINLSSISKDHQTLMFVLSQVQELYLNELLCLVYEQL